VGLGKGLVLQPAVAGLTELPGTESEVRIVVHELIRFEKMSESPMLESRTTYYGDMAEGVRDAVAKLPFAQIEGELALEYGRFYPGIQRVGHVRIEEAPDENAINVVQQFTIPEFFSFSEQRLLVQKVTFWNPVRALRHPSDLSRKMPFRLQAPGIYRHHIEISFPEDVLRTGNSAHFGDSHPAFQYSVEYKASPRRFEFDSELDLLKSEVAPEDWPSYTDKLVKLDPRFAGYLNIPAIALPQAEKLNAELREVSTSRSNAVTTVQRDARIRRIVLTAQLDSGRLSPLLRADTLRERGEQMDNMGKPEEATRDFEEAIQLAPNASKVFVSAATNAFARGRDERAAELAKNALALAPFDSSPHQILAFVEYYRGNYSEATGHLMAFGKNNRDETMKLYAALWLYLSAGHSGQDGIAAAKEQMPAGPSSRWPNPILQLLMGAGTLEQALKAAKDGTNDPSKLCELYFYLGEKSLFDGDKSRARKYFQQSIDTGVVEFNEYLFARRSLARLNE
jgi:lipoprotein NlpI